MAAALIPEEYGGLGVAAGFDVERKVLDMRLRQVAPMSTNPILRSPTEHMVDMPRSY